VKRLVTVRYALLLLAAAAGCGGAAGFGTPLLTDICGLAASPADFDGRIVKLAAVASQTHHYGLVLEDPACPRVGVFVTDGPAGDPGFETLRSEAWTGFFGDTGPRVEVLGRFRWRPRSQPVHSLTVLRVDTVSPVPAR